MEQPKQIYNDCEVELQLFKNLPGMNKLAQEVKDTTMPMVENMLTDLELDRYIKLIPGPSHSTRKRMIIKWLTENPSMMTIDPDLLYQRFFFYKRNFGTMAKIHRPVETAPIRNIFKRCEYQANYDKKVRHQIKREFRKKKAAEQKETQPKVENKPNEDNL